MKYVFTALMLSYLFVCSSLCQTTLYVDSAQVSSGDGGSWNTAYKYLHEAIDSAWRDTNVVVIRIAQGTYVPMEYPYHWNVGALIGMPLTTTSDNRDRTFHIRQGLELYGGYPSGGGTRDVTANPTVLCGAGVGGVVTDSAYHVLLTNNLSGWPGGIEDTTVLDGFTIRHGRGTDVGSLVINGSSINRYAGAGIYSHYANLQLKNNTIVGNRASYTAGGYYGNFGSHRILNNTFSNNTAAFGGGYYGSNGNHYLHGNTLINNSAGIVAGGYCGAGGNHILFSNAFINNSSNDDCGGYYGQNGNHHLVNNTFFGNAATGEAGGYLVSDGNHMINNNIFWGNTSGGSTSVAGADIINTTAASVSANFNLFQIDSASGYNNIMLGANNIYQQDPLFLDTTNIVGPDGLYHTADDGLQLMFNSPAYNSGSNDSIPAGLTTDITGADRIQVDTVDMGAYEIYKFPCGMERVLYVDSSRTTPGDGTSWATAFNNLDTALYVAWQCLNIDTICVAKGTYVPMVYPYEWNSTSLTGTPMTSSTDNRDKTFHIRPGLELYGGYPSGGGARDLATNPTICSGAGVGGVTTDSSYHVILTHKLNDWPGGNSDTLILDGFTITQGRTGFGGTLIFNGFLINRRNGAGVYSLLSSARFTNNTIMDNIAFYRGGGFYCSGGGVIIDNNTLLDNIADHGGGYAGEAGAHVISNNSILNNVASYGAGCFKSSGTIVLYNNIFVGNAASNYGGGYYGSYGEQIVTNNTFSNNAASYSGGGYYGNQGEHDLLNCIFWGNKIGGSPSVPGADLSKTPFMGSGFTNLLVNYSMLQLANSGANYEEIYPGPNNIFEQDPLFADSLDIAGPDDKHRTSDDGLRLLPGSPAINVGNNGSIPSGVSTDIAGVNRVQDMIVDMGAYESDVISCIGVTTLYVDSSRTHSGAGISWATAFKHLQDALNSDCLESGDTIRVAAGTYYPDEGIGQTNDARHATFNLPSNVVIVGGYTSNGVSRDSTGVSTILSGNIGDLSSDTVNCYHTVFVDTSVTGVVLDGFTIASGYASGSSDETRQGAGLLCLGTLSGVNLIFKNNTSLGEGAALYVKGNGELSLSHTTIKNSNHSTANIILGNDLNSVLSFEEEVWIE